MAHRWDPICPPPRGLVLPVRLDPDGLLGPTKGQARGPRWRQAAHGWYVPATVDRAVPEQRTLEASVLLPSGGAVTGWASLRLHGANFFDGRMPDLRTEHAVMMVAGHYLRDRPGVTFNLDRIDPAEIVTICGIPCTRVERATFDAMRLSSDVRESVVVMDMVAAAKLTSISRMVRYVDAHGRWNGVPQARRALGLAAELSASPNETRMRLIWRLDAGFPSPLVNQPVWDLTGGLLGIADLFDPHAGVVGEFDGADHRAARRHSSDVDRECRLRSHGLELFRVTGLDLLTRAKVVRRMAECRERALSAPPGPRAWTMVPPPHWRPSPALDDLLDQRDADNAWARSLTERHAEPPSGGSFR